MFTAMMRYERLVSCEECRRVSLGVLVHEERALGAAQSFAWLSAQRLL